jgi:5-methylthioribose kinase
MTAQLLAEDTVGDYLASRTDLAGLVDPSTVRVREVGDGNLNLVFIARDAQGRSLAIKQTLPYVRGDHSWAVTEDSILAEARGLQAAHDAAPELAPAYHGLDEEHRLVVIEDLSRWRVWRSALGDGAVSPGAGAAVGRFVARVSFATSPFGRLPEEVQARAAAAVNPELWRITEDLVFTEPFADHPHNSWEPEATDLVVGLREESVRTRVGALKHTFLTRAEALLHGDLHTGSVFVPGPGLDPAARDSAAKVFDFEFGAYGPVAFDLGMLLGNVVLAQARDARVGIDPAFTRWLAGLHQEVWDSFTRELRALWPARVDRLFTDDYLEEWLADTWRLVVGYAGVEAVRRTIGWAQVSDLTSLADSDRAPAQRHVLRAARRLIEDAADVPDPRSLAALVAGEER